MTTVKDPESTAFDNVAFSYDVNFSVTPISSGVEAEKIQEKTDSELHIDRRFGYGPCKPQFLQIINKIWVLVIFLVIFNFLEGFAVNGIANSGLPGIERQFKLTSAKSSLIPASQDIGTLTVILFVSHIGSRYHKPMIIASGSVILAFGSFVFIIPHLAEKYVYDDSGPSGPTDTCGGPGPGGPPPCESAGEKYVGVLALAQAINGIGFSPMFTLGTVYMDENSTPGMAAVYVGLCYAATAVGVASGFFAGGQFMQNWFVDFDRVDTETLGFDATDPRWVGAWWLGFVFSSVAFLIIAIPIYGYPEYMPDNNKAQEVEAELQKHADITCWKMVLDVAKDFFKSFVRLAKNPTFVFTTLAGCLESLILVGISAFAFKYLVEMYSMRFDDVGILLGCLILVGAVGMFLGGLLIRVFNLEIVGMLRLNSVATILACVLGFSFLASCPEVRLAGLEVIYPGESVLKEYSAGCNADCDCDAMGFNPVCGQDGVVYYSACHAGCSGPPSVPMSPYTNCTCVAAGMNITNGVNVTATRGRCDDGCTSVNILTPCLFIMMICVFTAATPTSMATIRCVDEGLKPFALGVSWVLLRLLGSIPGPVLIGSVIDSACKLWAGGICGTSGFCLLYSKDELALRTLLWWVIVTGVTSALYFIASLFARRSSNKGSFTLGEKISEEIPN